MFSRLHTNHILFRAFICQLLRTNRIFYIKYMQSQFLYRWESILATVVFPSQKNNNAYGHTASVWNKFEKSLAVRRVGALWHFASVKLTVRFPITLLGVGWEPGPPPHSMGLSRLFKTCFLSLSLRHRNAVTWTCDQHTWFSLIYIAIVITPPFCNNTPEFRVIVLSFSSVVLFLWRAAFCPFSVR
jgi:hypothetical protein